MIKIKPNKDYYCLGFRFSLAQKVKIRKSDIGLIAKAYGESYYERIQHTIVETIEGFRPDRYYTCNIEAGDKPNEIKVIGFDSIEIDILEKNGKQRPVERIIYYRSSQDGENKDKGGN